MRRITFEHLLSYAENFCLVHLTCQTTFSCILHFFYFIRFVWAVFITKAKQLVGSLLPLSIHVIHFLYNLRKMASTMKEWRWLDSTFPAHKLMGFSTKENQVLIKRFNNSVIQCATSLHGSCDTKYIEIINIDTIRYIAMIDWWLSMLTYPLDSDIMICVNL